MYPNNCLGRDQFPHRLWHLPEAVESMVITVGDEQIELWVPPPVKGVSHYKEADVRAFFVGPNWECEGAEHWDDPVPKEVLFDLCEETGLLWSTEKGTGPERALSEISALIEETDMKIKKGRADQEWLSVDGAKECRLNIDGYEEALDQWREEAAVQSCLGESRFVDYNPGDGESFYVRNSDGKISMLTADQLDQRVRLNIGFNLGFDESSWKNDNHYYFVDISNKYDSRQGVGGVIEPKQVGLEIVATGQNFSVAKWDCGGVYIPKAASVYLRDLTEEGWCQPGKKFLGNIVWANSKYPWRLANNGVVGRIADN